LKDLLLRDAQLKRNQE